MTADWGIIGHHSQVALVQRSLRAGPDHHAYLIAGPERVGKTTIAIRMAQQLNCEADPDDRPCLACRPCRKIAERKHADVRMISVMPAETGEASSHKAIRLQQIHEAQHEIQLKPFEGRYRVLILEAAERMNREAANAFLKTLEEPPDSVVVILLTATPDEILPTVRSRCQQVGLRPVGSAEIAQGLIERHAVPADLAARLAQRAAGRIGWAIEAAQDERRFEKDQELASLMDRLLHGYPADRFREAESLAHRFQRDRFEILDVLHRGRVWWRDVLVMSVGCPDLVVHAELEESIGRHAMAVGFRGALRALAALERAERQLEQNVQARLALDAMVLGLPNAARS